MTIFFSKFEYILSTFIFSSFILVGFKEFNGIVKDCVEVELRSYGLTAMFNPVQLVCFINHRSQS